MNNKKRTKFIQFLALCLAFILVLPTGANAAIKEPLQPFASSYLSTYGAYTYAAGNGVVQVWFDVQGTGTMDELGTLSIEIYESSDNANWDWVKTFNHDTTSGMLSYSDNFHSGHVSYNGVAGRYYKAYVCAWGGKNGSGDTRWFWTSAKLAT